MTPLHSKNIIEEGVELVDARRSNYVWFDSDGWHSTSEYPRTNFPGTTINIHGMPRGRENAEVAVKVVLSAFERHMCVALAGRM